MLKKVLGVGSTTPHISLYPTCANRVAGTQNPFVDLDATEEVLPRMWAEAQLRAQFAEAQVSSVLEHISTAAVARDMLALSKAAGQDKIRYWGFSFVVCLCCWLLY